MATRTSTQDGLASESFDGEIANGDDLQINHNITFDMDFSGMANGIRDLSIAIDKRLIFKNDAITYFKWYGKILLESLGKFRIGTEASPIQRPPSGSDVRCTLHYTGRDYAPIYEAFENNSIFGWAPTLNHSFITEDLALNEDEIPLETAIDVQPGEKIVIACGTDESYITEDSSGIYTVSSVDGNVITLAAGLEKARNEGDVVAIYSRPICFRSDNKIYGHIYGAENVQGCLFKNIDLLDYLSQHQHCTYDGKTNQSTSNGSLENVTIVNSVLGGTFLFNYQDTVIINPLSWFGLINSSIDADGVVFQNIGGDGIVSSADSVYKNCIFRNLDFLGQEVRNIKLYNCIIDTNYEMLDSYDATLLNSTIESFNHNQVVGAYKNYQYGGTIETQSIDGVLQPGKLVFKPQSNDYPVFKDYPIYAPANRITKYYMRAVKDFTGGTVKAEIIDPTDDPLIDPEAEALDTALMPDLTVERQSFNVSVKPEHDKQLILRVSAKNSQGTMILYPPVIYERFRKKELK
jgi:hypothetical protein